MDKKLKGAVIGTGGMANWVHGETFVNHPETMLVAACDIVPEKVEAFARKLNVQKTFTDYRKVLKIKDLDFIDICTPNILHSEIAVAALEAGKHVFCEKPDAVSVAEAQKMADAAKASGKTLMVMRNNRYSVAAQFLRQYIGDGMMGEIYTGRCGWVRRRGLPGRGSWFADKKQSGGGPLIDLGVHYIDLAMWLMGDPKPVSVSGSTYRKFSENKLVDSLYYAERSKQGEGKNDVEDLAIGFIRFANGASLQVEFSWASNVEQEERFLEFRGTRSGCHLSNGAIKLYTEDGGQLCDVSPRLQRPGNLNDHALHLHHFVDVMQKRAKPMNTPETGLDMIKILAALYESAEKGAEVRL